MFCYENKILCVFISGFYVFLSSIYSPRCSTQRINYIFPIMRRRQKNNCGFDEGSEKALNFTIRSLFNDERKRYR